MQSAVNYLRGIMQVHVEGQFPERFFNLCAQEGIAFWGLVWEDPHSLTMNIHRDTFKRLRPLAQRAGCTIEAAGSLGLPAFLGRFRRRYTFWIGFALSLLALCILSSFVLTVQVTGNEKVPTAEILGELRRLGLRPGAFGPGLETKHLAQEALTSLKDLSWMTINLHGTRAEVIVREVVPPPELTDKEGCYDIVARADGLVLEVEPLNGEALVKEGDTILEGDILITGHVSMKPPMYSDLPVRYYQTHAHGAVIARTWRTVTAKIPVTAAVKAYTGEEVRHISVSVLGWQLRLFQNSSISLPFYEKITHVYTPTLPGGLRLPVGLRVEHCRGYTPQSAQIQPDAAQTLLEERLQAYLEGLLGEEGEICAQQFSARVQGDWLEVTLRAECKEQVGREVEAHYNTAPAPD